MSSVNAKQCMILPLVRELTATHYITRGDHIETVGEAGDYLCTYVYDDECLLEWIESYANIFNPRYYKFLYGISTTNKAFFAQAQAWYVTPRKVQRISHSGKFVTLVYPGDIIMETSSGIRFLIEVRGGAKETRRPIPLHINTSFKKSEFIIEPV